MITVILLFNLTIFLFQKSSMLFTFNNMVQNILTQNTGISIQGIFGIKQY